MNTKRTFITLMVAGILTLGPLANAQTGQKTAQANFQDLTGSWIVTPNIQGPGFVPFVATYTSDGNVLVGGVVDVKPPDRPPFQLSSIEPGVWVRTGDRQFRVKTVLLAFDETGARLVFRQETEVDVTISESGEEQSGTAHAQVFDPDGKLIDSFTGTFTGKRIKITFRQ
jgi:hypothetical protein